MDEEFESELKVAQAKRTGIEPYFVPGRDFRDNGKAQFVCNLDADTDGEHKLSLWWVVDYDGQWYVRVYPTSHHGRNLREILGPKDYPHNKPLLYDTGGGSLPFATRWNDTLRVHLDLLRAYYMMLEPPE